MARPQNVQMAFNAGEISPRLYHRFDFTKYKNAVKTLENFIPLVHGGVRRRAGSRFISAIKDETKIARLLEFQFNTTQAYIIESGPGWMRFYRESGQIVSDDTDGVIANGTFDSDISSWTGRSSGTGTATWDSGTASMKLHGAGAGNEGRAYQGVTIGAGFTGNVHVLKFKVNVTTPASQVAKLRIGTTVGGSEIVATTDFNQGWHCIEFTPGATTFYVEFESLITDAFIDDVSLIDDAAVEIGNDFTQAVSDEIQYAQDADVMWLTHWDHKPMKLTRSGHATWSLTEYHPTADPFTSVNNYPRGVTMHDQRIQFCGTRTDPQKFWGSKSGNFENLTIGTADDDAYAYTLYSGKVNVLVWMASTDRGLVLGTVGSEFTAIGDNQVGITPTNIDARERVSSGSREVIRPLRVGSTTLFVQSSGRSIMEFVYQFETDNFVTNSLMLYATHLTGPQSELSPGSAGLTITKMAFKKQPDPMILALRSDGTLLSCTIDRTQDVVAWARQIFGGAFGTGQAVCEDVAVIPHPDKDRDQAWVIVKRTINGSTRRYVEFLGEGDGSYYNDILLDSAITGGPFGVPADTLTGLAHLEGQTVHVLGDGAVYANMVVSSGQITGLSPGVTVVEVGLPYTSTLVTLRPFVEGAVIHSLKKQQPKLFVIVQDTLGIEVNGQQFPWRSTEDLMDSVVSLKSEEIQVTNLGWDRDATVTIRQTFPMPTNILAIAGTVVVEDA